MVINGYALHARFLPGRVCSWGNNIKMKKGTLFFILISTFYAGPALSAAGDQYLLPKFGIMSIKLKNADPLISYGVMWGFGMSDNISFEAEYNSGFSGGDYEDKTTPANPITGYYRVNTVAGYLVYRHPIAKTNYFKTKLGLLNENVEITSSDPANPALDQTNATDETGVAGGIGFGSSIGERLTLELEVTVIDKDIVFYSLGTHYRF